MGSLTIGRLAKRAGISPETVRFYGRLGLLPEPARNSAGYRCYAAEDVDRLRFIRRAKNLGFSLDDIAELLRLGNAGGKRVEIRALADRRIADLDHRLLELIALREALHAYARRCAAQGPLNGCQVVRAVLAVHDDG